MKYSLQTLYSDNISIPGKDIRNGNWFNHRKSEALVTRLSINAFYFAAPEFQITGKGEIHIKLAFSEP
jgi:hypothetical protein